MQRFPENCPSVPINTNYYLQFHQVFWCSAFPAVSIAINYYFQLHWVFRFSESRGKDLWDLSSGGNDSQDLWIRPLTFETKVSGEINCLGSHPHIWRCPARPPPCAALLHATTMKRRVSRYCTHTGINQKGQGSLFVKGGMMITRRIQNKNSLPVAPLGEGKSRAEKRGALFVIFLYCLNCLHHRHLLLLRYKAM